MKENGDVVCDHAEITPDYLSLLKHNGVPDHHLTLKRGAICTLMRNMSVQDGLVKNARVIIHATHVRFVEIQLIDNRTGSLGALHCIPRIRFDFSPSGCSWTAQRLQFPLRLAYATTFNSCQGLTLDRTVLDLRTDVFAHGQLYTALSRVRTRHHSRILLLDDCDGRHVRNVVFPQLLL